MGRSGIPAILLLVAFASAACSSKVDNTQHQAAMRTLVEESAPSWVDQTPLGKRLWAFERTFYKNREFTPAWIEGDQPTPRAVELIEQLKYSARHGLEPARYGVEGFERVRQESKTRWRGERIALDRVPELDSRMTYAYLQYAADLLGWTSNPRDVYADWLTAPKKEDLVARLEDAIANSRIRGTLEDLAPTHPQYKGLQAALANQGASGDGRVEQIRMNLERWRWAPRDLGERYVLVNVPAYQMQVIEREQPVLAMRVVVGKPDTPTPLFSDQMTYVVFSPYWNIPSEILRNETLPRLVNDPDYLMRNNIEVVGTSGEEPVDPASVDWSDESATKGLRFRQAPGPDNALGLVKFIFPNHFSVYLHDTPSDRLFFRDDRALSHGCIRVEKPVALARYVLQDRAEWSEQRITTAMNAREEQSVTLKQPLPVHIGYWTAWVEPDGKTVTYTADPYGIDKAHARRMAARRVAPVTAGGSDAPGARASR